MKIVLIFFICAELTLSQNLVGSWVDENFNVFKFSLDSLTWSFSGWTKDYSYEYFKDDFKIKIITYLAYQKDGKWIIDHPVNLIAIQYNENELTLKPDNENAKKNFFPNNHQIKLKKLSSLVPQKVELNSLFFQSSGCLGNCQPVTFYLDENLNFFFIGGYNLGSREGYFSGKITNDDKEYLESVLSNGFIQKIPEYLGGAIDAQYFTIRIKRDGVEQRIEGTDIPGISWRMIKKLIDFHLNLELTKSEAFTLTEDIMSK